MTERWQRELKRLRGVEAPGGLRDRVDRGPTGEPPTGNRQRVIAGVVAFAIFAAAGGFAWRALAPRSNPADVGDLSSALAFSLPAPAEGLPESATAGFLGLEHDVRGWPGSFEGLLIPDRFPTAIPVGTAVSLSNDGPSATMRFYRCHDWDTCDEGAELRFPVDGPASLPPDPGIVEVVVTQRPAAELLNNVGASWHLVIQLVSGQTPVITLLAERSVPVNGYLLWDGKLTELPAADPPGARSVPPTFDAADFATIPAGSTVALAGNVRRVDGSLGRPEPPYEAIEPLGNVDDSISLQRPGRFVLDLNARWTLGTLHLTAWFYLPIDVTPSASSTDGVVIDAESQGPRAGFSIRMTSDGVEIEGSSSGFTTTVTNKDGTGSTQIGDAAAPEFHPSDFVQVPAGASILVLGNATNLTADVSAGANPFEGARAFDVSGGSMPPLSAGKHVLFVQATWEFGPTGKIDHATTGAGMYFPIEIVPAAPPQGTDVVSPVLRIDCSTDPAVATSIVTAARPGVRIRFADHASERRFELRWASPDGSPVVERGPIPGRAPLDLPIPPGTASVRCDDGAWLDVSVVDPLGLWASPVLGCGPTAHLQPIKVDAYPDAGAIRAALAVRPTDVIRGPDYPGTVFVSMLPGHMVVVRDGETVATLEVWGDHIDGEVCVDSGIGPRR